jgi:branched-chain amino acid aminotransferase
VDGRLRLTITGGHGPLGSERSESPPTVLVAVTALLPWPRTVAVATLPWTRNERGATTGLKTISYAENVRALAYANARGAGEAVFANTRGELCEATGSNVFVVRDGALLTPPIDSGCLPGVTRALVLKLAPAVGVDAREEPVRLDALAEADEAFLTSTTREVHPIEAVDATPLVAPGAVTALLAKAFTALVERDTDP